MSAIINKVYKKIVENSSGNLAVIHGGREGRGLTNSKITIAAPKKYDNHP